MKKIDQSQQRDTTFITAKIALLATFCSMIIFPGHAKGRSEPPTSQESHVQVHELSIDDSSQQILGVATGYIHPFLSIEEGYSDNIFYTREDEKDDFYTTVSPGMWVATPRSREIMLHIDPSNTAPGGLAHELQLSKIQKKFLAYALYEADILSFSSESQNNTTEHTAEAALSYAYTGHLTLGLIDKYTRSFDDFKPDGSRNGILQKYDANVLILSSDYTFGTKFSLQGVYSNFHLDYDRSEKAFRDRTDNTGALYLNYQYLPKTSFFLNGEYIRSSFDTATENDADQYNLYAGLQWRPSGKTSFRMRLGSINRLMDSGDGEDVSEFAGDVRIRYGITGKTSLTLLGASNVQIPDNDDYMFVRNKFLRLGCYQKITSKVSADLVAHVGWRDYEGGDLYDRNDDYFLITPSIRYNIKKWMAARLSYSYEKQDSSIEANDYSTNTVLVELTFSL